MRGKDYLAEHFERLCDLPQDQQRREIDKLTLAAEEREELLRLLAADQSEGDPIRQAVAEGAANVERPGSTRFGAWQLLRELGSGGMGTVFGPLVGSLALLLSEEVLKAFTDHWMMILGPLIVLVVLTARRGVYGYLLDWDAWRERRSLAADAQEKANI